jgi:hypothetical protein
VTAYSTRDPPGWIVVGIAPTCRVEVQTLPGRKLASVDVTTWQRTPVPPALAATRSTLPPTSPGTPPADESYISDADLLYALAPLLSDALGSTIGSTRGRIQRRGQSLPGNLAEHARGGGKRVRFSVTSPYQEIHIVEGVTVSANLTREAGSGEEEETRREQEDLEDSLSRTLYMDGVQQSSVEDEYVCVCVCVWVCVERERERERERRETKRGDRCGQPISRHIRYVATFVHCICPLGTMNMS